MTTDEFIDLFVDRVYRSAVSSVVDTLATPPGRRPSADLVKASSWFRSLTEEDRRMVHWIIADAAHAATFGALAVLDGSRSSGPISFEVVAVDQAGGRTVMASDSNLHEAFQSLATDPEGQLRVD